MSLKNRIKKIDEFLVSYPDAKKEQFRQELEEMPFNELNEFFLSLFDANPGVSDRYFTKEQYALMAQRCRVDIEVIEGPQI